MKLRNIITLAFNSIILISTNCAEETKEVSKEDSKKHITLIVGTHHYSPNKTMPKLKLELERLGFEVALLNPDWDPEKDKRGLPGLEVLKETDLAVFFTRWLTIEGEQYEQMMGYVQAGKPVVGLRTSGHGFNYPEDDPKSALNNGFGRDVLGSPYRIHLIGKTKVEIIEDQKTHPVLTGVSGTWTSPGTLYLASPEEGTTSFLKGTGNSKRVGTVKNHFGTHELEKVMTDNIAWTWTNKHGGKTLYTSLGHQGDFAVPQSMRVIVNGIHWAAGVPIPSAETEIKTFEVGPKKKKKKKGGK